MIVTLPPRTFRAQPRAIGQTSALPTPPPGLVAPVSALYSWINTETPKIAAWVSGWIARVPANPTQAQAIALRDEYFQARADYSNSYQKYVYQPWQSLWDNNANEPSVQRANQDFAAAFAAAFKPAADTYEARVRLASLGKTQAQLDAEALARQQEYDAAALAWSRWESGSAIALAELETIYSFARSNPKSPDQAALRARALVLRDQLFALIDSAFAGAPVPVGWSSMKTRERARFLAQLAFDKANSQILSNAKLAQLDLEFQQQQQQGGGGAAGGAGGDVVVYDGGFARPATPPAASTIFGLSPVVVGIALLLLLLARSARK